jgi:hypothetical protein
MKAKQSPIWGKYVNLLAIFILAVNLTSFQIQPVFAASTLSVDNNNPACNDTTGNPFCTIQAAIDSAIAGDMIYVYPGDYNETAANRTILVGTPKAQGPHQFGLFLPNNKAGLSLIGVDETGTPITDPNSTDLPYITTNATNSFGASGIWVEGDDVTIQGFEIGPNIPGDNKTIEIVADGFTVKYSNFSIPDGGAVYLGDWFYDAGTSTSAIESYIVDTNIFDDGTQIAISNGVGYSGSVSGRMILNNTFAMAGADWPAISFNGSGTGVPWFVDPVGGTLITGNSFSDSTLYIRSRGTVKEADFDWASYWNDNTFDKKVMAGPNPPAQPRAYTYMSGSYEMPNTKRIGSVIQAEIGIAQSGDTVLVGDGTYTEMGQIVISKDLTMVGADKLTTILKPGQNTGTSGDARTWILVNAGVEFNLSNVMLDGSGKLVETAFLSHGTGVFENNIVKNMYYNKYVGRGVALYGGNMTIRNNSFSNIQRIGMYAALPGTTSAVFDGNTYVGKGPGDWLDYGIELEAGAHAEIMNNTISDAVGVAASDGSTSAGLYLSTFFAPGTSMNAHNNILLNNTVGIAVGYYENDTSTTVATHNKFEGNEFGIATTGPAVTAASNWWGSATGPLHTSNPSGAGDAVSDNVNFTPWLCSGTDTSPEPGFQPSLGPNASCTNINVEIAGVNRGPFPISSQGTLTQVPILGVNNGPVKLSSTISILGGQRSIYKVGGVNTSFSEIMGVPEGQLDTTHWFPWYNNGRDLDTQLRIGNASTSTATVQVFIGADEVTPDGGITLLEGQSTRLSYPGLNAGPVRVVSNVNIVAAERLIYKVKGVATSFSEMMGLPQKQLDRTYWLPWYNNIGLDTQLRIANASDQPVTVTVTIGDVQYPSFDLAVGESTRKSFDSVNTGPVKIESTQDIVAAQRIIYKVGGVNTSFSEMMAFAADQLDTVYWFPRYNNGTELDTQFRLVNVSETQDATVHIFVGENEVTPPAGVTLSAGESERLSYTGVNGGLVRVESDIPIVVSERVIYKVKQVATSFTELMGLPDTHRDTIYWLPWYNHSAELDTQLRFGLP